MPTIAIRIGAGERPHLNPAWLRHQYVDLGRGVGEIARECGVSHSTLSWHLSKLRIHKRSQYPDMKIPSQAWLRHQYLDLQKSTDDIAALVGVRGSTVCHYLNRLGIPRRSRTESLNAPCVKEKMSIRQLGKKKPEWARKKAADASKKWANSPENKERRRRAFTGPNNPVWNGGRTIISGGYVSILAPDHPFAGKNGRVLEHRLIAERVLGRYLKPSEVVHHVNEITDDNRPANLILCQGNAYHRLIHKRMNARARAEEALKPFDDSPKEGEDENNG